MIVRAAIQYGDDNRIETGRRHSHIFGLMASKGIDCPFDAVQGFVDENGKFYTRTEAMDHAKECGQIFKDDYRSVLYSEDLW